MNGPFLSRTVVLDRERVVAFATEFDPQPQHLDDARAAASPFGELVASGWQTAALSMHLAEECVGWDRGPFRIESLLWQRPVRPGDALCVRVTLEPEDGSIRFRVETLDQDGQVVQTIVGKRIGPADG